MSTQIEKVKQELIWAVKDARHDSAVLALFERASGVITILEDGLADLLADLEDCRQDFESLSREFDEYVADHN